MALIVVISFDFNMWLKWAKCFFIISYVSYVMSAPNMSKTSAVYVEILVREHPTTVCRQNEVAPFAQRRHSTLRCISTYYLIFILNFHFNIEIERKNEWEGLYSLYCYTCVIFRLKQDNTKYGLVILFFILTQPNIQLNMISLLC